MQAKKFGSKYIIRLDKGEEAVQSLMNFCREKKIKLGTITGIGATDKVKIGLFNPQTKEYTAKEFIGDYEIVNFVGTVTTMKSETYLHCHIVIGDNEQRTYSGHVNYAYISATFEAVIEVIEGEVDRRLSKAVGLNLLELE